MSGVDVVDQYMVYYTCGRKSMKWYKCALDVVTCHWRNYNFIQTEEVSY